MDDETRAKRPAPITIKLICHHSFLILCKAAYGERTDERANSRNGYRDRLLETRAGSVDLKIPKLHTGSYLP